jgi:hypothetical protein
VGGRSDRASSMRCGRKSLRPPSGVDPIPPLHHWTQRVYAVLIGVTAASRYLRHVCECCTVIKREVPRLLPDLKTP